MKGATRSIIAWLAVAAMTTLVLACQEVMPAPAASQEEPPAATPTLLGTWERIHEGFDRDGDLITTTTRLVFAESGKAESGKAFWHNSQFDLNGDDRHDPYGNIADWSATEDTIITKTFIDDEDDDGQWDSATIDKSYYLSGSGNVLFVHHWDSDETEDAFERYTRVQDPVPSNPTLLGTWEAEGVYHEHDDLLDDYVIVGKKITTLTFTENRYILVETPRDGDEVVDYWHSSGTWTPATESRVTKTFVAERHRDDDGTWTLEKRSFDKEYTWGAGGELFVMEWRGDWENAGDAARPYIERYTRVENPLPPLAGTWVWQDEGGQARIRRYTLTIGEAFTYRFDVEVGGENIFSWSYTGSWRQDESKQYLFVDVQSVVHSNPEVADRYLGHELRFAYAAAGIRDEMLVSGPEFERTYDSATDTWAESEDFPYGAYFGPGLVKQP
jgi:hypothetical protein